MWLTVLVIQICIFTWNHRTGGLVPLSAVRVLDHWFALKQCTCSISRGGPDKRVQSISVHNKQGRLSASRPRLSQFLQLWWLSPLSRGKWGGGVLLSTKMMPMTTGSWCHGVSDRPLCLCQKKNFYWTHVPFCRGTPSMALPGCLIYVLMAPLHTQQCWLWETSANETSPQFVSCGRMGWPTIRYTR